MCYIAFMVDATYYFNRNLKNYDSILCHPQNPINCTKTHIFYERIKLFLLILGVVKVIQG